MNDLINRHQQPSKPIPTATQSTKADAVLEKAPASQAGAINTPTPAADAKVKTAQLDALVKQLSRQGSVQAEVSSSQRLDTKAQQLLAKANPSVAAQLQNVASPTRQPATANVSSQHQPMYLVKLAQTTNATINSSNNSNNNINNNAINNKPTLLTTITPTPFKVGDQLQLQLNTQQQITIKPSVASVRPVIADSLKNALPQQQNLSLLLNTLSAIGKLPAATQDILLAKNIQTALQQLSQFTYTDKQLNSGNSIKNALANSGVLTENKLQQQQSLSSDLRTVLGQLSQALTQSNSSSSSDSQLPKAALDQIITQLIQQLPQTIITAKPSSNNLTQQVTAIMQLLGFKTDANVQTDIKKIKDATAKKIGQMAQGVQDKIHLNQLRLLGADSQSSDNYVANHAASKSNAFITEIALRWGDQVLPLQLSIAEDKEHKRESHQEKEDTNNKEQEDKKIARRWQVFMSFDLPSTLTNTFISADGNENGNGNNNSEHVDTLHSQLTIIGDTVSATLWSESSTLCHKAKQQFSTLRNTLIANGLQVDELQCINGKPPSQKMSLDYHLVDITT